MKTGKKNTKTWSSRSLASNLAHKIFYIAIKLLGRHVAYFMLIFVVAYYTCLPEVRHRSKEYRLRQFGPRSFWGELTDSYRLQWELGKMLVDRAVMGILGKFEMIASAEDRQRLVDLTAKGRGLILITGHVGCWQLGMTVLDHIDASKAVVMYKDDLDVDKHYFEHAKEKKPLPFDIIDPRSPLGGSLEMMDVLKKGGILCVMGDRNFGSPRGTVDVDFMGDDIQVPISAYKLASTMHTPIVVTFSHRTRAGYGRIWISRVIDVPQNLGRTAEAYQPYAQSFADGLEEFTKKHPWQFYNFYNMWKEEEK